MAQGGFHPDVLYGRKIEIAPNCEIQVLIRHELMKRFHAPGRTGLDLQRRHPIPVLKEIINLALPPPDPLPVEKSCLGSSGNMKKQRVENVDQKKFNALFDFFPAFSGFGHIVDFDK